MDLRNRIGLYGSYFLCMAGIGFILPYLPLYLHERGLSESAIGFVWTASALAGLLQFPLGVWSERLRARKPFLLASLSALTAATWLLAGANGALALGMLVVLGVPETLPASLRSLTLPAGQSVTENQA